MATGIRVTVSFSSPENCPVAAVSAAGETIIDSVSTSVATGDDDPVTEFLAPEAAVPTDSPAERVFSYADRSVYRITHNGGDPCPCERLGAFGCPIERYFVQDGALTLVFHATDFEQLQAIFADLRERFDDVDPKRLVRAPTDGTTRDPVFVDRGRLTDRQYEVLVAAYDGGYFAQPRAATAAELAADLGIDPSTFAEHLAAAQAKLLGDVLEDGG
ncbi:MAG: helix-turn-helix domain-containing protein [Haloarculaceae archaeon]